MYVNHGVSSYISGVSSYKCIVINLLSIVKNSIISKIYWNFIFEGTPGMYDDMPELYDDTPEMYDDTPEKYDDTPEKYDDKPPLVCWKQC